MGNLRPGSGWSDSFRRTVILERRLNFNFIIINKCESPPVSKPLQLLKVTSLQKWSLHFNPMPSNSVQISDMSYTYT